jgi:hypothetical protein
MLHQLVYLFLVYLFFFEHDEFMFLHETVYLYLTIRFDLRVFIAKFILFFFAYDCFLVRDILS